MYTFRRTRLGYRLQNCYNYAPRQHSLRQAMVTLYGIKNCDTVKKACKWLDSQNISYQFHDFRIDGLEKKQVEAWIDELGWEAIINKRSTSWKALAEAERININNQSAVKLILETPTLIKRPLLDTGKRRHLGFKADEYKALLNPQ